MNGRRVSVHTLSLYVQIQRDSHLQRLIGTQASLLAAVTTSFIIEAQKNLKEDPANTAIVMLGKILHQLNQTAELETGIKPFTSATTIDKLTNALWFTSLALSLSTVTIGLLCLQWILECKRNSVVKIMTPKEYFNFMHHRGEGFGRWKLKDIISILPLLLIPSLVAFFAALLIFLGTTNWTVAIPVYVIVLLTLVFLILTTLLPGIFTVRMARSAHKNEELDETLHPDGGVVCPPFRSPQSWITLKMCLAIASFCRLQYITKLRRSELWVQIDWEWTMWLPDPYGLSLLKPLILFSRSTEEMTVAIHHTLEDLTPKIRRGAGGKYKKRDANRVLAFQLQGFPVVLGLFRFQEKSAQCTDASHLQWVDYLLERYTNTVPPRLELSDPKKKELFWTGVDRAIWEFKWILVDIPAGRGNYSELQLHIERAIDQSRFSDLLTRLLSKQLEYPQVIGEGEDRAAIFWTTLGLVLTHPSLPPRDLSMVVFDSLNALNALNVFDVLDVLCAPDPPDALESLGIKKDRKMIPGRKMEMVIGVIKKLTAKLEQNLPRARHFLYRIARHRLWPHLQRSEAIEKLIQKVQAEEVIHVECLLDGWDMFEEGQEPSSSLPAEALPGDTPSSAADQAAVVTEVSGAGNPLIVAPPPTQPPHSNPLEDGGSVDSASSMAPVSDTNDTDGAGEESSLSAATPGLSSTDPLRLTHPPPILSLTDSRPRLIHRSHIHQRESSHSKDAPSFPIVIPPQRGTTVDFVADEPPWPIQHPSPRQRTLPLHSEKAPVEPDVTVDVDESIQYNPLPTPGEDMV